MIMSIHQKRHDNPNIHLKRLLPKMKSEPNGEADKSTITVKTLTPSLQNRFTEISMGTEDLITIEQLDLMDI